jgi:hypothetical protein
MTTNRKYITGIEMSRNMFGELKPLLKEALYNYYDFPSNDSWNDIYGMVIAKGRVSTVWQAVLAVDPTFPQSIPASAYQIEEPIIWTRIPDRELFVKALNFALKQQIDKNLFNIVKN